MQFHLDGYRSGDPRTTAPHPGADEHSGLLPAEVDVLVVGSGPAGLLLAAQLAAFPDLSTAVVDRRGGALQIGQADGVACRSVEVLEAFGLAEEIVAEGYRVNEVAFWRPDPGSPEDIVRSGRIPDVEDGLSEFPHVIVNQARVLDHLREHMARSASRLRPCYSLAVTDLVVDPDEAATHPVQVTLAHVVDGVTTTRTSSVRARVVVGCDGARSRVRTAIGRELVGDATNQAWGVMDVLVDTDFPDIRLKATVLSAEHGNMLIIPREGGYLVRLYIELDEAHHRELREHGGVTPQALAEVANRILHPYTLQVRDVGWWSVYEVGQRLCAKFDDVPAEQTGTRLPRVLIAGDACHTHSAKAGQGMNVSMADAWNLGWKLAAVLGGCARPALLDTYSAERQVVAQELIDFDREFARTFGTPPTADGDPAEFQRYFTAQGRFTAGVATRYAPSMITAAPTHQHLAKGFEVGTRFHSAPVVRLADARPVQLGHAARADGAWRLYLLADRADAADPASRVRRLCAQLAGAGSPLHRHTPPGAEPDSVLDVRAVFQQPHRELDVGTLPAVLRPRKGRFGLVDHEKVYCPDPAAADLFDLRGVDRDAGAMVLVRPDQHVAHVLPLDAHDELATFLGGVLLDVGASAG